MTFKKKWDDDKIAEMVNAYNVLQTRKDRREFLKDVGLRRDNLKRMAINRGLKLNVDLKRHTAAMKGVRARWGKPSRATLADAAESQLEGSDSVKAVIAALAELERAKHQIEQIRRILEG